jgi:hypothetical protein
MNILISNKELLDYTKLSGDINSIIIKYVNYTLENINKMKIISYKSELKLSLLDMLILCKRYNSQDGFYITGENYKFDEVLNKQIVDGIIRELHRNGKIYYYFKREVYDPKVIYVNINIVPEFWIITYL